MTSQEPIPLPPRSPRGAPALVARGVTYSHGKGAPGVSDVSFTLARGETLALMGHNGSGKTTLLKVLARVRPLQGGTIELPAEGAAAPAVGYIPQQLGLVRNRTALANVLMGSFARTGLLASLVGAHRQEDLVAARDLLTRVGLAGKMDRRVAELSGGERQRVAICRAFLQRPTVLLADEFTSNLDIVKAGEVLDVVREFTARGMGTVMAFHNVELAREYADRILFIRNGRLHAIHDAADVTHDMARGLLS